MELLERAIVEKGKVLKGGVLKVGSFLNNQIDVNLISAMGKDIYEKFKDCGVNKILTVEASGIAIACFTAQFFNCNAVFAKKSKTANVDGAVLSAGCFSFTHKTQYNLIVPKEYLGKGDKVLIIDDFLANGEAINALIKIVKHSGAELVGAAVAIEKGFQGGGDALRKKGVNLYSLAIIDSMEEGKIVFRNKPA
ncbi:MAG: xanthine phosphoribosyltransferase [Clostridia bacterium]|nr:xanthine phosphoribosyltransferase [Clostridia bacterium]